MAARCRAFDWAATPLGPVDSWPPSLRTTAAAVLATGFPAIVLWGPDLIQLYNDAYLPFLGVKDATALGAPTRACWPEVWDFNAPIYARVRAGETVTLADQRYTITRRGPDGPREDLYLAISYAPVRDETGAVGGTLVTLFDTTAQVEGRAAEVERARLAAELATERARVVEVFRQSPSFLAVMRGPEHVFASVNDAYTRLVGGREVVGHRVRDALPEAVGQRLVDLLDRVFATGERFVGREVPVQVSPAAAAPTEERFLDFAYLPLRESDAAGVPQPPSGVIAHGIDVTDQVHARREVERLLADSERARERTLQLQALTAALAEAQTIADVAAIVVADVVVALGARTGAIARRMPDGEAVELLRTVGFPASVAATVHRQSLDLASPLTECIRAQAPVWVESRGGPAGLDVRYSPIAPVWDALGVGSAAFVPLIAAGDVIGAISFSFEGPRTFSEAERAFLLVLGQQAALAVERARLFDAEHAARAEAEAANAAKSQFLANMSHEQRTPLNAIQGYVQLLDMGLHGPVTEAQRSAFQRVDRAQRHLLGLVNDVLNFARLGSGRVEFDVQAIPVADVVADVLPLVEPQLAQKGLSVTLHLDAPVPAAIEAGGTSAPSAATLVWADREKLGQILLNLLSNAAKFTPGGGRVTLGVTVRADGSQDAEHLYLRVADTGIGIPADRLDAVFEPFVQVRSDLTRETGGTGLGLAISRDLARGMGGDIRARSTEGVGSAFTLVLRRATTPDGRPIERRAIERRVLVERRREAHRRQVGDRRADGPGNAPGMANPHPP